MAMEVMADTEPPTAWGADATTLTALQCPAEARGQLSLRLTMVDSDTDMELTSQPLASQSSPWSLPGTELLSPARPQLLRLLRLITLLPSSASVRLTPRLMPTTAMEDTVSATPLATVLAMAMAVTARGLPTLRLMPTTAMEAMVDTVLAMEAMVDTVLATAMAVTARGLLTLRLTPTTAMEDMVDTVLATPLATVLATDTVVTERGPLILRPTPTMVMVDMVDTASASMESLPHA